jgi:hypothetical protein
MQPFPRKMTARRALFRIGLSALDGASNVTKPFAILQFAERELLL